jgi:hypothetical protein
LVFKIPKGVDRTLAQDVVRRYSMAANTDKIRKGFDMLICSAGYEDRSAGFLKRYASDLRAKTAIVFLYRPKEANLYLRNLEMLGEMREILVTCISKEPHIEELDPADPWAFKELVEKMLRDSKINELSNVLVDITSFTRVFLYELIRGLYSSKCKFTIVYTEPDDYTEAMPAGVKKLVVSPSFMGKPRPNKKSFLLIFFGWETGRSKETFDNFNSDDSIGVYGVEPIDTKHVKWQIESYDKNLDLIRLIGEKNIDQCPTLELDKIVQYLHTVYNKRKVTFKKKGEKWYFAISGFGPKIQNLASCFFAITHRDVQLVYGAPSYWGASDVDHRGTAVESNGIGDTFVYGPFDKKSIIKKYAS